MYNIGTRNGISELVSMQDLFNEWYAKNTRYKIRKVFKSKGELCKLLTTNPPCGYMKNPDDKYQWIIDELAKKIVKRIFQMYLSEIASSQIENKLSTGIVLSPTEYWISIGRKCDKPTSVPFHWCPAMIANILKKQEDWGQKKYYQTSKNERTSPPYFICSSYSKNPDTCTSPYIWEKTLTKIVIEKMRRVFWIFKPLKKSMLQTAWVLRRW